MSYNRYALGLTAVLATNDPLKVLELELLGAADQNIELNLRIKSQDFSGYSAFSVTKSGLRKFAEKVGLHQEVKIHDEDSEGYIHLSFPDDLGHIAIDARVGGSWTNFARVLFETDQTALSEFVHGIGMILATVDL